MMRHWKTIVHKAAHTCLRLFDRGKIFWGGKMAHISYPFFVSTFLSQVARIDLRAAHKLGMPVEQSDVKRRAFLKYTLFGGVVFLAGKYVNPLINMIHGDTVLSEKTFNNFKMTETGKQLQITDDEGSEILTIDKEGF
jgi:hypothetical protein